MKNNFFSKLFFSVFLIVFIVVLAGMISCKNDVHIVGGWTNSSLQKTELLKEPENFSSIFAYAYVQKTIEYNFREDGKFEKTVFQKVKDVEYLDDDIEMFGLLESGTTYILEGSYTARNNTLVLTVDLATFKAGDEEIVFSGNEMDEQNILLESQVENLPYELVEDKLSIWDFQIMDYLKFEKK